MGTDVFNVNNTHLITAINSNPNETGMLKDYKASIKLKRNVNPSHFKSHKLLIHILPFLLLLYTLRDTLLNSYLHICKDNKISVNHTRSVQIHILI